MAGDGSEGEVHVGLDGRVVRAARWPWGPTPVVGSALEALFHPDGASVVRWCLAHGWGCLSEQVLLLEAGVPVRAWAEPQAGVTRMVLRDVSASFAVERCAERQRQNDALAELAGSLARELSNPMAVVLFRLELLLLKSGDPAAWSEDLRVAFDHTRAVTAMLRNLRSVGRFPCPSFRPASLRRALDLALALLGPHASYVEIALDREDLEVGGEEELVGSVCAILLRRTLDVIGLAPILLSARAQPHGKLVIDIGPAVGRWDPARVTDEVGYAATLLDAIGGSLRTHSAPAGPRVQVWLPQPVGRPQKARTVIDTLLVAGERLPRHVEQMLAHDGFAFLAACTAEEALPLASRCTVALIEVVLGGPLSGRHLAAVLARSGSLRVVLVSDQDLPTSAIPDGAIGLRWPASRDDLLVALGRARR